MLQISAEFLALSGEAAILVKNGNIIFVNNAARNFLGKDCVGKNAESVLGKELCSVQAPSFIGEFFIKDSRYIVHASTHDGMKAFFFSPVSIQPNLMNDALLFAVRSCMMNMDISLTLLNQAENLPQEIKDCARDLRYQQYRINRILQNLSLIRSISENSLIYSPENVDVSAHLSELIDSIRILIPDVDIRFSSPGPLPLFTARPLLDSLMLNLISNCICHAGSCSRINITMNQHRDSIILSVDDNGHGIEAQQLHTVFDRYCHEFFLGDISRGAGLGLSVVRLIARLHSGTLLMESRENHGTNVRVSMSAVQPVAHEFKQSVPGYIKSMGTLLTGLAGCLPIDVYSEKYAD